MHFTDAQVTSMIDIIQKLVVDFGILVTAIASYMAWRQGKSNGRNNEAYHEEAKQGVQEAKQSAVEAKEAAVNAAQTAVEAKDSIAEVHASVNGKMEQLLSVTRSSSHAEGMADQRSQDNA